MYKLLIILNLILVPGLIAAAEEGETKKLELSAEDLAKIEAAKERYKDNPAKMKIIKQFTDAFGLNEEEAAPAPKPRIQGSYSVADDAYKNKDYETALEHYEALAAEGDSEANLILGTMYEQGLGTDKDTATAHAYYRRAAETNTDEGDTRSKELLKLIEQTDMTEEDLTKADERYQEINDELQGITKPGQESEQLAKTALSGNISTRSIFSSNNPAAATSTEQKTRMAYRYNDQPRQVKIAPEKYHRSTESNLTLLDEVSHFQPERYFRN